MVFSHNSSSWLEQCLEIWIPKASHEPRSIRGGYFKWAKDLVLNFKLLILQLLHPKSIDVEDGPINIMTKSAKHPGFRLLHFIQTSVHFLQCKSNQIRCTFTLPCTSHYSSTTISAAVHHHGSLLVHHQCSSLTFLSTFCEIYTDG